MSSTDVANATVTIEGFGRAMSNNAEVKYLGKPETFSFLKKSKSCPDP